MPFVRLLDTLVAETDAYLAIFCDYEGEAIAFSFREGLVAYDVKVIGATLTAVFLDLQRLARSSGQSERVEFVCVTETQAFLVEGLPGGYYVVLGVPPDSLWVVSRSRLKRIVDRFLTEL